MALSRLNSRLVFINPGLTFLNPKPRPMICRARFQRVMANHSSVPWKIQLLPWNHTFRQWKTTRYLSMSYIEISIEGMSQLAMLRPMTQPMFRILRCCGCCFETLKKPTLLKHGEDRPFGSMSCLLRWCSIVSDLNNIFYHILIYFYHGVLCYLFLLFKLVKSTLKAMEPIALTPVDSW